MTWMTRMSRTSRPSWRACCTACMPLTPTCSCSCCKWRSSSCSWGACGGCATRCLRLALPRCAWYGASQEERLPKQSPQRRCCSGCCSSAPPWQMCLSHSWRCGCCWQAPWQPARRHRAWRCWRTPSLSRRSCCTRRLCLTSAHASLHCTPLWVHCTAATASGRRTGTPWCRTPVATRQSYSDAEISAGLCAWRPGCHGRMTQSPTQQVAPTDARLCAMQKGSWLACSAPSRLRTRPSSRLWHHPLHSSWRAWQERPQLPLPC
mmetsp:Transcript_19229/g.53830  ORF Transcript_19229/g.53830 Transcript_19229/m.53830 type:complete len:263 (-) Transcript_19229:841-1629(-)